MTQADVAAQRRDLLRKIAAIGWSATTGALTAACAAPAAVEPRWQHRLAGNALVLLGEVHDNADGQQQRATTLRTALLRGWRPALAMEQFDHARQPQIDKARRERPRDADWLIEQTGDEGWDWALYRPLVQLAIDHDLPLLAANLSRPLASRIIREEIANVLGSARATRLGLDGPLPIDWLAAHRLEIASSHCGALPEPMLPAMARAQIARDAVMADVMAGQRSRGVVLIAGNGHVRRDLGVAWWLETVHRVAPAQIWTVGYLESNPGDHPPFDAVVPIAAKADRPDPCLQFRR